jgi:photosystem II stability/assembly factor-like uncharacterized protein
MKTSFILLIATLLQLSFGSQNLIAQSLWSPLTSGTNSHLKNVDFWNDDYGIVVGENGTILRTTDGGNTWAQSSCPISNNLNGVSFVDSLHIIIVGDVGKILKSENAGQSWDIVAVPGVQHDLLSVDILPGGQGVACGRMQTILWTEDAGLNWRILRYDWFGAYYSAQMLNEQTGFIFGENSIMNNLICKIIQPGDSLSFTYFYVTVNNLLTEGKILDGYYFNPDSCVTVGAIFPGDAVITCNQPWGNNEWNSTYLKAGFYLSGVDFVNNYGVAVGGAYNGSNSLIVESFDHGLTWMESSESAKKAAMNNQVKLTANSAYIVGNAGKILKKSLTTGTAKPGTAKMQVSVYPNPASDHVNFKINTEAKEEVIIRIFNVQGIIVKQEVVNNIIPGIQVISLSAKDLAPGCYFYHVISAGKILNGKVQIN